MNERTSTDWDAELYGRLVGFQVDLARRLLARLPASAPRRVVDAGCGSGEVTAMLLEHLPDKAHVTAVDRSPTMLEAARQALAAHTQQVTLQERDLATYRDPEAAADLVFSNAALHWVDDHASLFARLHAMLRPGGWLMAQYAYRGDKTRLLMQQLDTLCRRPEFAPHFEGWAWSIGAIDADDELRALQRAGFADITLDRQTDAMPFDNATDCAAFFAHVVLHEHMARLPTPSARQAFADAATHTAQATFGATTLFYDSLACIARA